MITVKSFLTDYCQRKNLTPPSNSDLENCGRIINHHFKRHWVVKFTDILPGDIILEAGLMCEMLGDKKIIVQAYPDNFESEMEERCDLYFAQKVAPPTPKKEKTPPHPPQPKKRKRIVPAPEFSAKPSLRS